MNSNRRGAICLCAALVLCAPAYGQGFMNHRGAGPDIRSSDKDHALQMEVRDFAGALLNDAAITVKTMQGTMQLADLLVDGTHFIEGIGTKTTVVIDHPVHGTSSMDLLLPDIPRICSLRIFVEPGNAKAFVVERREIEGAPLVTFDAVAPGSGGVAGGGGSDCCDANRSVASTSYAP